MDKTSWTHISWQNKICGREIYIAHNANPSYEKVARERERERFMLQFNDGTYSLSTIKPVSMRTNPAVQCAVQDSPEYLQL